MTAGGVNLDHFFEAVEGVKDELKDLVALCTAFRSAIESARSLRGASDIRVLRARVVADASAALVKAKLVKLRFESLDRVAGSTPSDGTRASVAGGIRGKLRDAAEAFREVKEFAEEEHREAVGRRFHDVTGVAPDAAMLSALVSSGEARLLLRAAVQAGQADEKVVTEAEEEIRERHGVTRVMYRSLGEVQRVLMVPASPQGQQRIDGVESRSAKPDSSVQLGMLLLQEDGEKGRRRGSCKWVYYGLLTAFVIVVVVVSSVLFNRRRRQ